MYGEDLVAGIIDLSVTVKEMRSPRCTILRIFMITALLSVMTGGVSSALEKRKTVTFTVIDGLPVNMVTCFLQDSLGYSWVGTKNGLARFDGYSFFQYDSLRGLYIFSMILDDRDDLWVSTNHGVYTYDRLSDNFKRIFRGYTHHMKYDAGKVYFLLGKNLMEITEGAAPRRAINQKVNAYLVTEEGLWFSTGEGGLRLSGKDTILLPGKTITLLRQTDGILFAATNNGQLYVRNPGNKMKKIPLNNHEKIMDIEKVHDDHWIATNGNGIFILDKDLKVKDHLYNRVDKASAIPSNSIYDIFVAEDDAIWVSSFGAGLACLLPENMSFVNIIPLPDNKNSLVAREGYAAYIDGDRYLLGTNYGFSEWNIATNSFRNHTIEELMAGLRGTKIRGITKDRQGYYWIATYDGLLGKYSPTLRLLKTYHPVSKDAARNQEIVQLFNIDGENLLIASNIHGKNLVSFNTRTGRVRDVTVDEKLAKRNLWHVSSIRRNQSGQIVVLINRLGLYQYLPKSNRMYELSPEINRNLEEIVLNDLYQDKQGNYWFATKIFGLVQISPRGEKISTWSGKDGVPTNTILRMESLDDRYLWISTIDGLCRLDMESGGLQIFDSRHGLCTNEFSPRSSLKTPDNRLLFGCSEGFVLVDPKKIFVDTKKARVVISDIIFQNTSIKKLPDESYLREPLEKTRKLVLPFRRNSFTIKFFTKDNDLPKYNNFAYRLKGLEEEWIYLGETNHTTYTNLSPGTYVFEVKSTNKSNVWNDDPTRLTIRILPPWYLTWWAFAFYLLAILAAFLFFFDYYKKRLHWKMEVSLAKHKARQEHELAEKKLTFFTNIAHDLKTVATLISAPIEDLLARGNLDEEQVNKLKLVRRNTERLYKLNNDLIEFRKITRNQLPLQVCETDITPVIRNIYESFLQECERKGIRYETECDVKEKVFVDPGKTEKILWNLLANAVKFTSKGGQILLKAGIVRKNDGKYLRLIVKDTGKGFSAEHVEKIFDRFYQVDKSDTTLLGGVGIGLFIVRELTQLHHGNIFVRSEPGKGSEFTVLLPAERRFFKAEEIVEETLPGPSDKKQPAGYEEPETEQEEQEKKYNRTRIVIVEDNGELRKYLYDHFSGKGYTVFSAGNGRQGLELIRKKDPDLVISDVKMPVMDGYELCDKVKNNFNTSHIPVILLTAKTALDEKLSGMYAGADSYITKPFEVHYLDAVARSILSNRKKLRDKFLGIEDLGDAKGEIPERDLDLITRLKEFILENMSDPGLNIEMLVKHFAMSRSQLNRKIKSLTGMTPNNYIKTIRLKKAYELLKEQGSRVSEVTYMVGFSDPNYFTLCFKKEFGENPSRVAQSSGSEEADL